MPSEYDRMIDAANGPSYTRKANKELILKWIAWLRRGNPQFEGSVGVGTWEELVDKFLDSTFDSSTDQS